MVSSADLSSLRIAREPNPSPRRWVRPKYLVPGVLVIAVLITAAVVVTRPRAVTVQVTTAQVRGGAAGSGGLTANGYIVARTKASVSSKLAGRLAYLGVEEGDRVRTGAVIARLEAAEYAAVARQASAERLAADAARIEAEAGVLQANRALERARALAASSLVAKQALEDAETAVDIAVARLRAAEARVSAAAQGLAAAEANLENTRIRAPFSGTILRKDAEVGEVVAPSVAGGGLTRGAVVTMADLSTLEVEVDVNEAYIGDVSHDQKATIVLDAYPSENFPGHVRQIVPTADRQKATVLVRVAVDSRDARILPEMGARVVFRTETDSAAAAPAGPTRVFVPATAVRTEGSETVVYQVIEGLARRRPIDAGPVSGDEREARRGLSGGETLIVEPPAELVDGTRVRINDNQGSK